MRSALVEGWPIRLIDGHHGVRRGARRNSVMGIIEGGQHEPPSKRASKARGPEQPARPELKAVVEECCLEARDVDPS